MCHFFDIEGEVCRVCSVGVDHIECASVRLCKGRRYEACPVYFINFFFGLGELAVA
ncbi:MAG: hypothetical protein P8Y77_09570 [Nitrospirota bacterium]